MIYKIDRTENDVIMDVSLIYVRCQNILIYYNGKPLFAKRE